MRERLATGPAGVQLVQSFLSRVLYEQVTFDF
jgi:hypothetical protein